MKSLLTSLTILLVFNACASHPTKTEAKSDNKGAETKATASAQVAAKETGAKPADGSTCSCTKGKDVRSLKIEPGSPKGCKATYTVNGADKVIATAANESGYCKTKVDKVKANLTAAGYHCK